jgi:hypothetical protein
MTNAELIAEIRKLAIELNGDTEGLPGLTKLRKSALEQLRDGFLLSLAAKRDIGPNAPTSELTNTDESVNETVDGGEAMTRWLALPEQQRTKSIVQTAIDCAMVPSPLRDYQSSQEALTVLEVHLAEDGDHRDGCECADCEEFYADEPPVGFDPMADASAEEWDAYDAAVDPQFAAEVDSLVARNLAADPPPAQVYEAAPITETDVAAADVDVVVQLKSRLYNGKLIAVVNRRTRYCQPILATVEVGGVRFLVNADDMLAA